MTSSRSRFLGQRHTSLPRRNARADDNGREHRSGGRDGDGVTRGELAHAVPETIRTREHRSPVEVAFEVIPEGVDGGISLVRFLLQRFENDRVEIARSDRRCVAGPPRRSAAGGSASRMASSSAPRESRFNLYGRVPAEQLVQHHPERIDIGPDGERVTTDLLGGRVVGCQRPAGELGKCRRFRLLLIQQLRDAEVEQPNLSVGGDQDVGGLQIPVHHELRVCVGDGIGDLRKQPDPRPCIELPIATVLVDGPPSTYSIARNGRCASRQAGVIETRDVRVRQRREDVALARHPFGEVRSAATPGAEVSVRQVD